MAGRRIGELAEAAGLTVRTLHYYEEIELLVASDRTPAGHRLYSQADLERLYRIRLLRRFGLPLGEIGRALDDPAWSLRAAMTSHLREVEEQLATATSLRDRLARLADSEGADAPLNDEVMELLEEMTMLDSTLQRRISFLVYRDIEAAYRFLTEVFGLGPGTLDRTPDGRAVHGEVHAGDGVIWLHGEDPDFGLASPGSVGAATSGVAVMVDDVDAHCAQTRAAGAMIVQEPVDQPYGYRIYSARDNEGGLWSFMKPLD